MNLVARVLCCVFLACMMNLFNHVEIALCLLMLVAVDALMQATQIPEASVEQVGNVEQVEEVEHE